MRQTTCVIDSEACIDVGSIEPSILTQITQRHTVLNPEMERAQLLGNNTKHLSRDVKLYRYEEKCGRRMLHLPRGTVLETLGLLSRRGYYCEVDNQTLSDKVPPMTMEEIWRRGIKLRPYQREALEVMLKRVQGHVVLPCGAGKTVIGSCAIIASRQPAIVLVHTEDLFKQWVEVFRNMHGKRVRQVDSSSLAGFKWRPLDPQEVAVCMVQTLHANRYQRSALVGTAGAVLVDECHHSPAYSFRALFEEMPARFRWGMTATPERSDGWSGLIKMYIGPMLYSKKMQEIVDAGYLMQPEILALSTGVVPPPSRSIRTSATKAVNWVSDDEGRKSLLLRMATFAAESGRIVLMLLPRVSLAVEISKRLRSAGVSSRAVTGKASKGERALALDQVREGQVSVLCATQLADEGLDLPVVDFLINASGGRASGRSIQRIGRVMRVSPDKPKPIVVEVVDGGDMFMRQWTARSLAYRKQLNCEPSALMQPGEVLGYLQRKLYGGF
jgi:superfamily II DNA or RNA helicase